MILKACLSLILDDDEMPRVARERHLVGLAHNHNKKQHHLQKQHFLPQFLFAIATLLVAPTLI